MPDEILRLYYYWATERQNIFYSRLSGKEEPFTTDTIFQQYKFTNTFRASDRVSQYLIRNVIYPENSHEYTPEDTVFRILLFKRFNTISTWQWIEGQLGAIKLSTFDFNIYCNVLDELKKKRPLYNSAYNAGRIEGPYSSKFKNHLLGFDKARKDHLFKRILDASSLKRVAQLIQEFPGVGDWLAYQFAIDLNYSPYFDFSENDYVICGPGAKSGIRKCYGDNIPYGAYEDVVRYIADSQEWAFNHYGLDFKNLFGRQLHLIDCQNVFCELTKYLRISHPHLSGKHRNVRFRFSYDPSKSVIEPMYPPKWGLELSRLSLSV